MIDRDHEVELNSVKYRIAWDAADEAFVESGEPLQIPNAQVIQGNPQAFNIQPDILLWEWSDWSGGEGQYKWDSQNANRAWRLEGVDPFTSPGKLEQGHGWDDTGVNRTLAFAIARNKLFGVDLVTQDDVYEWDDAGEAWLAADNNTVGGATRPAAPSGAAGDADYLYYIEDTTDEVYRWDETTYILLNDQTSATGDSPMVAMGDYLYVLDMVNAKLFEISKYTANTATPEVELVDFSTKGGLQNINNGVSLLVKGENRIYVLQVLSTETIIWEVTPTTAAGTGFGVPLTRVEGFKGEVLWFHLGKLFAIGTEDGPDLNVRSILYFQPGGNYGTLGTIRGGRGVTAAAGPAQGGQLNNMLQSFFFLLPSDDDGALVSHKHTSLWTIEHVTGGFAETSFMANAGSFQQEEIVPVDSITYRGQAFVSLADTAANREVVRYDRGIYTGMALGHVAVSPLYDGSIVEEKALMSVQLQCEPLEGSSSIALFYELNNSGTWTTLGTYATSSGTGTSYAVSTDSTTVAFHTLRIKVLLEADGSETPTLLGINVRSKVLKGRKRWQVLLDTYDGHGQRQPQRGVTKMSNIETAWSSNSIVQFKNGAKNTLPDTYDDEDVEVESYRHIVQRPGEAITLVTLVEAV